VVYVIAATWALTLFHLRREMEDNYLLKHTDAAASAPVEVSRAYRAGNPPKIAGVGEAIAAKIDELARTGRLGFYERLREEAPGLDRPQAGHEAGARHQNRPPIGHPGPFRKAERAISITDSKPGLSSSRPSRRPRSCAAQQIHLVARCQSFASRSQARARVSSFFAKQKRSTCCCACRGGSQNAETGIEATPFWRVIRSANCTSGSWLMAS
jgi:hypothetical protein